MEDLKNDYLTTKEAAERMGVSDFTIRKMIQDKKLDGTMFGRTWMVTAKSVDDRIAKNQRLTQRQKLAIKKIMKSRDEIAKAFPELRNALNVLHELLD